VAQVLKKRERMIEKILFGVGLLLFLSRPIPSIGTVVDRIVAVVNQEIITLSEVEKSVGPFEEEIKTGDRLERKERIQWVFRKALERLIEEKLIDQEVKKAGIKVGSKDVEGALDDIKKQNAVTQEDFEKALAGQGMTLEAFKKQIERRLLRMKLLHWATKVESKNGEQELRDFYQKNIDRYKKSESIRPSHILFIVPRDCTSQQVLEIRKKCQKVLEKIKGGEDFGEMALLYSEDVSSKERGDLGFFKRGELLPAFEKEALRLRVGEVSGIVRTDFGFHLIKLLDRKGGGPAPFEEVRERVQMDRYEAETQKALKEFISTLKEKAVIEIKL
jgi:peptidyl-prolyl cis-trans isomerase SurA